MNAIFIKEVPDTVLKGMLACLKHTKISNEEYIIEVNISDRASKNITEIMKKEKSTLIKNVEGFNWINSISTKFIVNRFKKKFIKLIEKNNLLGFSVIYSNEIRKKTKLKEFLDRLLEKYSIFEYMNISTVEKNMYKYIDEYTKKNSLRQETINVLVILNNLDNLNINLIEKLNEKYKEVNIFANLEPTTKFLNIIKKINSEYGSCISVLSKTEKDFRKYNICIFVDRPRTEYTKYKFNKKACFIDFTNKENDKFNEKYIKLEKGIKNNVYYVAKIKELYNLYGKITLSNAIID